MNDITYLSHHGVKGQKWGVRRFQFLDGALTALGKIRYSAEKAYKNAVPKEVDFQEIDYNNYNLNDPEQYEEDLKYLRNLLDSGFLESIGEDTSEGTFWALIKSPTGMSRYTQMLEKDYVKSGMKKDEARSESRKQAMNIVGFLADRSRELKKQQEFSGRKVKDINAHHGHTLVYRNAVKANSKKFVKKQKEHGINWSVEHGYEDSDYLAHHGIKGQKWGFRRYQNEDGSLTPEGRKRYGVGPEQSSKKYSRASVAGMEAKYQAKRAGAAVSKSAKSTANKFAKMHADSVKASKVRRAQVKKERVAARKQREIDRAQAKQERFEARQQRREEKAERMARKIAERESKKTLKELKDEFDNARISDARRKVERLLAKREKIAEKAALEKEARALKKENKKFKKDLEKEAKGKFSIKKIKGMSDEEIAERIRRLKSEAELTKLEASRNLSPGMKSFVDAVSGAATEATKGLAKDAVTVLGTKFLQEVGLDLNDKSVKEAADAATLLKKQLEEVKAQDEYNDYMLSRKATTDDERARGARLAEEAKRYQNMQTIANARRNIEGDPDDELSREAKRWQYAQTIATAKRTINPEKDPDADLKREATRYQNMQTIANAKRSLEPKESAEDAGKRQAQRITERKEMERRASAYRKQKNADGSYKFTIAEIAKRLGVSEDQVRDYLYE